MSGVGCMAHGCLSINGLGFGDFRMCVRLRAHVSLSSAQLLSPTNRGSGCTQFPANFRAQT